jgi:hypothetical protein
MALTQDITATYRGPRRVVARLLSMGPREDRALAFVMGACAIMFVAQWPGLAREAHLTGQELNMLLGGALLGTVFILPLMLYALSGSSHLVLRALGRKGGSYGARLALFWALLATSPLALLYGLVGGFIGAGAQQQLVGLIWFVVFIWFWISGLREAYWGVSDG